MYICHAICPISQSHSACQYFFSVTIYVISYYTILRFHFEFIIYPVLHDIIGTMFNKRFMDELFKQQELFAKKSIRTVFDRLAHASIMRLNSASMDKVIIIFIIKIFTNICRCNFCVYICSFI